MADFKLVGGGAGAEVSGRAEGMAVAVGVSGVVVDEGAGVAEGAGGWAGLVAASSDAGEFAAGDERGVLAGG